jgi:CO/xanthine dehydrogenase FAD-binding subunit
VTVTSYFRPASLPEALGLLAANGPSLLVIAGGTVAMPLINDGLSLPPLVMGLRGVGLDGLERTADGLRIGATVTLTRLLEGSPIAMLREAAAATASWSIRNMATVGGNLFTPPPGGDVAAALLALDARATLAGPAAEREVSLDQLWTGFMTSVLDENELLTGLVVPMPVGTTAYLKFGRRQANTPAVVTVAIHVVRDDGGRVVDARVALGAAGPHPIRAREAERVLVGTGLEPEAIAEAAAAASRGCEPLDDGVASEWYRRRMVALFVRRALERIAAPDGAAMATEGGR